MVPAFIDTGGGSTNGRNLLGLDELDVSRDIVDFTFVAKTDDGPEFYLSITEWSPHKMEIFMNFTDPMAVSTGASSDQIICKIKNPAMFISAADPTQSLSPEKALMTKSVPPQVPKGVDPAALEAQAASTQ